MTRERPEGQNARMIASARARLVNRKWACPECAGIYGCHADGRSCEVCSPPRNPIPRRRWVDED